MMRRIGISKMHTMCEVWKLSAPKFEHSAKNHSITMVLAAPNAGQTVLLVLFLGLMQKQR